NPKDHVSGGRVLHEPSIQAELDPQIHGFGYELSGNKEWTHRVEGGRVLAVQPVCPDAGQFRSEDPVARRDVVADRVSGHVLHRVLAADMSTGSTDDDCELQLPVVLLAVSRQDDIVVRSTDRARQPDEDVGTSRSCTLICLPGHLGTELVFAKFRSAK